MSLIKDNIQFVFFCLISSLPIKFTHASQFTENNLIEFSLSLQNQTTYFKFPTKTQKVKSDQIGISWYESFSKTFQAGLEVGYLDVSQVDNSLSSAQFSSGEYLGILFRFLPIDHPFASLSLNINYRYSRTETINGIQNSELLWRETSFSGEVEVRPLDKWGLLLATEYQNLSGEQRDFSSFQKITPFSASEHSGYRIGISFKPYATADISLEWLTGYRKGHRILFKRRF